jgi:hypothetical protein
MLEKGSEEDTPSSKSFSPGAKWWEVALIYAPTLLKLLASLGLFSGLASKHRQNSNARRAAKRAAMLARPEENRWC